MNSNTYLRMQSEINPYREGVQGKANEPITVAATLQRASQLLGLPSLQVTLHDIWERLHENAPRIAVIGGSPDHPAHIADVPVSLRVAYRIWQDGGVPFIFGIPVICDGTAQSNIGMCYSLQSRLGVADMVINQMEGHAYHGAFVLQGCDKTPAAILCALGQLDRIRLQRGESPVVASFAPTHVLKGGVIPDDLRQAIEAVAKRSEAAGAPDIANDLRGALQYILQCTLNTQFQGAFTRAQQIGVLSEGEKRDFEKRLAVHTCEALGGICAFNGTGNSSRIVTSALGFVHPSVEYLIAPPGQEAINAAVDTLMELCDDPTYRVTNVLEQNFANAVRVHSTTGGSTNLMMHLVATMVYAGFAVDLQTLDTIRCQTPIPQLFDYSLTQQREHYRLAQQYTAGMIRGMDTLVYELQRNGVPMHLDAPTMAGCSWRERLADTWSLSADHITENPILLSTPQRSTSGVDMLTGNWFETAVVKISGMPEPQIDAFDEKAAFIVYFENEEDANAGLLNINLLADLRDGRYFSREKLLAMYTCHCGAQAALDPTVAGMTDQQLFDLLVREQGLRLAIVISGQGPQAFGMPEMFTPMQHINANGTLKKLAVVISDGRYSGVTYGAAIGHVTPEAAQGGSILYLCTGDILHLALRRRTITLCDPAAFSQGDILPYQGRLDTERSDLAAERLARIASRRRLISAANRLMHVTDAARGVVPQEVAAEATMQYRDPILARTV